MAGGWTGRNAIIYSADIVTILPTTDQSSISDDQKKLCTSKMFFAIHLKLTFEKTNE